MQITERIHALKIPFTVPVSPEIKVDRFAFVYLIFGEKIHLIDSGVAGAEATIRNYIQQQGRLPEAVSSLLLTHAHPDHIGSAQSITARTGCTVFAHRLARDWIENTEQQFKERPVPGFPSLVEGPVPVDNLVEGGETIALEENIHCTVFHTPGHSNGSISLLFEEDQSLFTGDALVSPGDLPMYDDISTCFESIDILKQIEHVEHLFSSWEPPIRGLETIRRRMDASTAYLERIHTAVLENANREKVYDPAALCQKTVKDLGLPPSAANPLVAKAFASSLSRR